ncbi:MAG: hypothetical protein ACOCXT_00535 [Candidatus Dojkabacteria bacterium]
MVADSAPRPGAEQSPDLDLSPLVQIEDVFLRPTPHADLDPHMQQTKSWLNSCADEGQMDSLVLELIGKVTVDNNQAYPVTHEVAIFRLADLRRNFDRAGTEETACQLIDYAIELVFQWFVEFYNSSPEIAPMAPAECLNRIIRLRQATAIAHSQTQAESKGILYVHFNDMEAVMAHHNNVTDTGQLAQTYSNAISASHYPTLIHKVNTTAVAAPLNSTHSPQAPIFTTRKLRHEQQARSILEKINTPTTKSSMPATIEQQTRSTKQIFPEWLLKTSKAILQSFFG